MADVSGKGFSASILVGLLDTFFKIKANFLPTVDHFIQILIEFNQLFLKNNKSSDFICFKAIHINNLVPEIGIINAGLPGLIIQDHNGHITQINHKKHFIPLGVKYCKYSFLYHQIKGTKNFNQATNGTGGRTGIISDVNSVEDVIS